jgi:hypothetical protein
MVYKKQHDIRDEHLAALRMELRSASGIPPFSCLGRAASVFALSAYPSALYSTPIGGSWNCECGKRHVSQDLNKQQPKVRASRGLGSDLLCIAGDSFSEPMGVGSRVFGRACTGILFTHPEQASIARFWLNCFLYQLVFVYMFCV